MFRYVALSAFLFTAAVAQADGPSYSYIQGSYQETDFDAFGIDVDGDGFGDDVSYGYFQVDLGKSYGDWGDFGLSMTKADEESGEEDPIVWVSWAKGF